jgi:hypothetical protein
MCSCCYPPEISPFLPVVQLCEVTKLQTARELGIEACRQKGSIADEMIELHAAVLHRTQEVSPPMVELGQSRHFGRRQTTSGLPPGNGHRQGDPAHPKSANRVI